jgi:hypothetical protein
MKTRRFPFIAAAAAAAVAATAMAASCVPISGFLSGSQSILLVLPALPPGWDWLPDKGLDLAWREPGGRLRCLRAEPGSSVRIAVDRGLPQAILARPSSAGRGLRPAGALYPQGLSELPSAKAGLSGDAVSMDRLVLSWEEGYAASVALILADSGLDPWAYDLASLAREARARCGDPWLVPALETARLLASLSFRIDLFKEPRRFAVALPEPGPWACESPFAPAPAVEEPPIAQLPEGLWRFLGQDRELLVRVDAEGGAAIVALP